MENHPVESPALAPRLLERLRVVLRVRHYSDRTERACVDKVRWIVNFHGRRHPQQVAA